MKKILILASSALLLLAGCAKELQSLKGPEGGLQTVSFTAQVAGDATKAAADGDGAAASVNRCIMEIYYGDDLFTRMYAPVSNKKASFTTQLVSNRTYTVAFWADHVESAASEAGLIADLYYTTNAEGGLKAVALKGTYAGNDDARDAFFYSGSYTVAQGGSNFDVTLKRPFAQVNVITTDWDKVTTVESLKPTNVDVTVKNPYTVFNAVTGEASTTVETINYNAAVYAPAASGNEKTLSMDYLFAATEKQVIDIDFKAQKSGDTDVAHTFTSIPYQRNYRTNIKGALLTTTGKWNVTVDPIWESPDEKVEIETANNVEEANTALKSLAPAGSETKQTVGVSIEAELLSATSEPTIKGGQPWDGRPLEVPAAYSDNTDPENPQAKVEQTIFNIAGGVSSGVTKIIIRDERDDDHANDADRVQIVEKGYPGSVFISAPGLASTDFDIQLSGSTVYLNGTKIKDALVQTAQNTFVIDESSEITGTLTVKKGNIALFGKVNSIVRDPANADPVTYVDIYESGVWTNEQSEKSSVLIPRRPVAKIGSTLYFNIVDALTTVDDNETVLLLRNITLSEKLLIDNGKTFTFDLGGKTITGRINVNGAKMTIKNGTIDAGGFAQALNVYGSSNPQYKQSIYTYVKVDKDVVLNGSTASLAIFSVYGNIMYPLSYGLKVDLYGRAENEPIQVSGNVGYDNYKANIGDVDISANLPAGVSSPSKAMSLYGPEINIYGDVISTSTGDEPQGFILSGMARVNVFEGANVEGSDAFAMKSGNLTIYGGTIKATGAKSEPIQFVTSGSETSGAAISISSSYTYDFYADRAPIHVSIFGGNIQSLNNSAVVVGHTYDGSTAYQFKQGVELDITGGEFTGATSEPVIKIDAALEGEPSPMPSAFISGGVYNKEPSSAYVNKAYKAVQRQDGKWIIGGPYEARIATVYYEKFTEAVAAVKPGETITLLTNVSYPGIEDILLQNFSVDGQGKFEYDPVSGQNADGSGYYILDTNTSLRYYDGGKELRNYDFEGETLTVPEGVVALVGSKGYRYNTNLKYVKLSSTVRKLGNRCFGYSTIEKIYYKDGENYAEGLAPYLTTIEPGVFMVTSKFNVDIVIPAGINQLSDNVFQESNVKSITFHEGMTNIGVSSGRQCPNLTEITLPSTITKIGGQAFRDCLNLKTINLLFENVPDSFGSFTFNAASTAFGANIPGVFYVKNETVANALVAVFDSEAKKYYSIKNVDDPTIVYYTGTKVN